METTQKKDFSESIVAPEEILALRKAFTRKEYDTRKELKSLEKKDPLAYWEKVLAQWQERASSSNDAVRGESKVMIARIEETIRSLKREKKLKEELLILDEAAKELIKDSALDRGPLFRQKVKWFFSDTFSWFGIIPAGFKKLVKGVGKALADNGVAIFSVIFSLSVVWEIVYGITFGLGVNSFLAALSSVVLLVIFLCLVGPKFRVKRTILMLFWLALQQTLFTGLLSVSPEYGYAYVVKEGEKIVRVVDTRNFWMPALRLGQQKVEFYDLYAGTIRPELIRREERTIITAERELWVQKIGEFQGRPAMLQILAYRIIRGENLRKAVESGRSPEFFREDLRRQVEEIIDLFPAMKSPTRELELQTAIARLSNDLYSLSNVSVDMTLK